jgi:hypothetical protein
MHYSTKPSQIEISDATISVKITTANGEWEVTALLARCPPTVPIDSTDVKIVAYDVTGAAMPVRYRPGGLLTEVGGSLSTTVNATFRFAGSEPPNEVVVEWAGGSARFRVTRSTL